MSEGAAAVAKKPDDTPAEDKGKSSESRRHTALVRIDPEVARRGKIAAAYKGQSFAEYLSETMRPIIERDIDAEHEAGRRPPKRKGKRDRP